MKKLSQFIINLELKLASLFAFQKDKTVPSSHKRQVIRNIQKRKRAKVFIETGTFRGDTVESLKDIFSKLYSIELDDKLYQDAKARFKENKKIAIIHGDRGKALSEILDTINDSVLFWLDGHYDGAGTNTACGELVTPIVKELEIISDHSKKTNKRHVILIDDIHCFNGEKDYPKLDDFYRLIGKFFPDQEVINCHDIIQIL